MLNLPIGIFDSGIGGLTIAHTIKTKLPNESIIYFGDTKHLPYGEKSDEAIQSFSKRITSFLVKKQCKAIVIACNSASSVAFDIVKEVANNIPVFNVIDPVINKVIEDYSHKTIGVIGTKATIKSNVYKKKIANLCPTTKVCSLPTPLLAPMIEEGFINEKISDIIIDNYLANKKLLEIDCLILACTHYPLIYQKINKYYKEKVKVINSPDIIGNEILRKLKINDLLNKPRKSVYHFFVSNYTESFEKCSKSFFQEDLSLEEVNI